MPSRVRLGLMIGMIALTGPLAAQAVPKPSTGPNAIIPDLGGVWTNATVTPLERPTSYGNQLVLSPAEVAQIEHHQSDLRVASNKATDVNATVVDIDKQGCEVPNHPSAKAACGYNAAWTDPGDLVMRVHGEGRTSFITSTANGRMPPFKAGFNAPIARGGGENSDQGGYPGQSDNPETRFLGERCLTSFGNSAGPVMLPLLYNNNYEIVQSKNEVAIMVEMVHDVRIVRIGVQHRTDGVRPWFGDSVGHYEGGTLVVETTNFPKAQAFYGAWEDLKVTEKFTRTDKTHLLYQFTVEAPSVWEKPWSGEYEFSPTGGIIYEYACHEGNYGLESILAGARSEDAIAAAKGQASALTK